MFFNVGGYEILVIAVLALIFIGPDQLPTVMRKVGRYAAQIRGMAHGLREEFMSGLDEMPELKELTNLDNWTGKSDTWLGKGTDDDPIVPRGFAERERQREVALEAAPSNKRTAPDPRPDGGLNQAPVAETDPSIAAAASSPEASPAAADTVATDAVPTGTVPTGTVPTDTVPTDTVPTDGESAHPPADSSPAPFAPRSGAGAWNRPAPTDGPAAGVDVAPYLRPDPAPGADEGAPA